MFRIEAACAGALYLGAIGVALSAPTAAQDALDDGSNPMSAGADGELTGLPTSSRTAAAGTPGHTSGSYAGVVPGAVKAKPPAAAKVAKGQPTITWPGFQMRPDGSSRVFIQSNAPIEAKVLSAAEGKFEVQLPHARVAAQTNRLPLDTRFFNTPVTRVSVNVARSGAVVHLDMRSPVAPQITSEQGPGGYFFTYIELPKGEYLKRPGVVANGAPPAPPRPAPSKVIGKPVTFGKSGGQGASASGSWSTSGGASIGAGGGSSDGDSE
jgi:hypothetical protein